MLKDNIIRFDVLDNIDDCYIDKDEESDTIKPMTHAHR
jgi:hypothetical protein